MSRTKSSSAWLQEHQSDHFVQQSKKDGYRSRAVYKLIELHEKDQLFRPGQFVIDLGAAPGGWTEYASQFCQTEGKLIAVDLLPIDSVAGANIIQGDFTDQIILDRIMEIVDNQVVDLVLSDMAPNISGMESIDLPKSMYLAELAFELAKDVLKPDGSFVVKLFHGEGFEALIKSFRQVFKAVRLRKPNASRSRSREVYAVCSGLK